MKNKTISDLLDPKVIVELENQFAASSENSGGRLSCSQLVEFLAPYVASIQVEAMFRSMDINDIGSVSYADFTNFLITMETSTDISSGNISKLLPAKTQAPTRIENDNDTEYYHRDNIDCLVYVHKPCSMIVSGGRDGLIGLWDTQELRLIKLIDYKDKNLVFQDELVSNMTSEMKALCIKNASSVAGAAMFAKAPDITPTYDKKSRLTNTVPITALCSIVNSGLLCVGTADCCVSIYELGTQELCGRFTNLNCIPTSIEYFRIPEREGGIGTANPTSTGDQSVKNALTHKQGDLLTSNTADSSSNYPAPDKYVAIGDSNGTIHFIGLHPEFGASTELGSKKKNQILFAESLQRYYFKLAVHAGWVTEIRFISETCSLISAGVDGKVYFINMRLREGEKISVGKVFNGHKDSKLGVKTLDWSAMGKYVVSGAERTLLFWDTLTFDTVHSVDTKFPAPVVKVAVSDEIGKVFAGLANRNVFVWNNLTFELLQTIAESNCAYSLSEPNPRPAETLSAMTFSPTVAKLFVAGTRISEWSLQRAPMIEDDTLHADLDDICSVLYSAIFQLVVVVKTLGQVQIFHAMTGIKKQSFQITSIDPRTQLHMSKLKIDPSTGLVQAVVKLACLDSHETRLIAVGYDSSLQLINFLDGTSLLTIFPQLYSTALAYKFAAPGASGISHVTYETAYVGTDFTPKKLLFLGTSAGNLCGYNESNAKVIEVPIFFWMSENSNNRGLTAGPPRSGEDREKEVAIRPASKPTAVPSSRSSAITALHRRGSSANPPRVKSSEGDSNTFSANPQFFGIDKTISVLWTYRIEGSNTLLAGYGSGEVIAWDMGTQMKLYRLCSCSLQLGPELQGMWGKDATSSGAAAPFTSSEHWNRGPTLSNESTSHSATMRSAISHVSNQSSNALDAALQAANSTVEANREKVFTDQQRRSRDNSDTVHLNEGYLKDDMPNETEKRRRSISKGSRSKELTKPDSCNTQEIVDIEQIHASIHAAESIGGADKVDKADTNNESRTAVTPGDASETVLKLPRLTAVLEIAKGTSTEDSENDDEKSMHESEVTAPQSTVPSFPFSSELEDSAARAVRKSILRFSTRRTLALVNRKPSMMSTSLAESETVRDHIANRADKRISFSINESVDERHTEAVSPKAMHDFDEAPPREVKHVLAGKPSGFYSSPREVLPVLTEDNIPPQIKAETTDSSDSIVIDCVVLLQQFNVLVGACNDQKFRFWDLATNLIICSCPYSNKGRHLSSRSNSSRNNDNGYGERRHNSRGRGSTNDDDGNDTEEVLKHLRLGSEDDNTLIGGYDNGLVRVWSMQSYSMTTLKGLLVKYLINRSESPAGVVHQQQPHTGTANRRGRSQHFQSQQQKGFGYGLTISPMMLLYEFRAHSTPLVTLEYISLDEFNEDGSSRTGEGNTSDIPGDSGLPFTLNKVQGDLQSEAVKGYLLTAGLDQTVILWKLDGTQIGRFGYFSWDLTSESTWSKSIQMTTHQPQLNRQGKRKALAGSKAAAYRQNPYSEISKEAINMKPSESTTFLRNFCHLNLKPKKDSEGNEKINHLHASQMMNKYVATLSRKIHNKGPSYIQESDLLVKVMAHHPMSEVAATTAGPGAAGSTVGVLKTPRPPPHAKPNKTLRKM